MAERVVKISFIIQNQLPEFIREEFPLVQEFLSTYYKSTEIPGGAVDVIQNIDKYVKVDTILPLQETTTLTQQVSFFDTTINVESTYGFPDSYGLIQIDDEILTYTNKTATTFEGCVRGFSGVTSLNTELTFDSSVSAEHSSQTTVKNLSILFLKEFLTKIKKQVTPGFEERQLYSDVNQRLFIKQSKDFYKSKGTDSSFKILFGALYGTSVEVIKPREYLIQPSDAQYRVTRDIVAEPVSGNPEELINGTLYQDADDFFPGARGTITHIEYMSRNGKDYYLIKLDYDFNKDIDVTGSVKSEFKVNPKTIVTTNISSGSSYIDVDSTVGFPESGELIVDLNNDVQLTITYQSKTLNQFFGCSGIIQDIPEKTKVKLNKYVYGFSSKNRDEQVRLRITGVLSGLNVIESPYLYSKDDTIQIKTLGSDLKGIRANEWFFNIPTRYEVDSVSLLDSSDFTYRISLFDNHSFVIGDAFTLTSSIGEEFSGKVIFIEGKKIINARIDTQINENLQYTIKKNVSKVDILNYPELNFYNSNVQNVYYDLDDSLYVTSPSLPSYLDQPIQVDDRTVVFSGDVNGLDLTFRNSAGIPINHSFYTGDVVVYKPNNTQTQITTPGVYFIKKINDNTVRLARSREDIYNEQYVFLSGTASNDHIEPFDFNTERLELKQIAPQGIIRKLTEPLNNNGTYETNPGPTGIFINGVELLNYKSTSQLFYGAIEEIVPISGGNGYDVLNPPELIISDDTGSGCIANCSVTGNLEKINIIDPGFDFLDVPVVTIKGGNGSGAKAKVNLVSYDHQEAFNAFVGVDSSQNTIKFLDYHKFRDYEEVIYSAEGNAPVGGLVNNSTYFVSVQDEYTVKLHKSLSDAVNTSNPINITAQSNGIHYFKSKTKKRKLGSVEVESNGFGYSNHKTFVAPVGINTALDVVTIKNHGYKSGEILKYYNEGSVVGGLSTTTSYYVTKLDDNNFKLSLVATGDLSADFYYATGQYVDLTSVGSGSHYFNYEPIEVKVVGRVGISSVGNQDFGGILQPVFRGEIDSVNIENGGTNYGTDDILDFNKQPDFRVNSGFGAQLKPIVLDGRVVDVTIQSSGSNYESIPDLVVNGLGSGCVLTPVISNGTIADVKVISSGFGYNADSTTIEVIPFGTEAKFEAKIKSWRVNLVEKNIRTNKITVDDGEVYSGATELGLQYTHLYAPRPLRQSILATRFESGQTFLIKDLRIISGREVTSNAHSPIIGWAYDGNPIYGPYGFASPSGGAVRALRSGYGIKTSSKLSQENRPAFSKYPAGFFVEDYEFSSIGDLDENNGRFCITPDFPNGVYAYFTTINPESVEPNGPFKNFRKPVFPYVIGNTFKSQPIEYNFDPNSNQNNVNLNTTGWVRNTTPYNLLESRSGYDYIFNPNDTRKQVTEIRSTLKGSVENIKIVYPGDNYGVGDSVVFENENTGRNAKAVVDKVEGVNVNHISVSQIEIDDVPLVSYGNLLGIKTETSLLRTGDIVRLSGPLEYNKEAKITIKPPVTLALAASIGSTTVTGIITQFNVAGINEEVFENDLYDIQNETVKILFIDRTAGNITVQRNIDNYVGVTSYVSGTLLTERQNKFITDVDITTAYNLSRDRQFYFNAETTVGLGTTFGVGISSTLFLGINKLENRVAIGTGSTTTLYFNRTLDVSNFTYGNYVQLADSTDSAFDVNRTQVVGVGNTFIVVDFDSSALSVGSGVTSLVNSWKTISIPTRTILWENHGLSLNDRVHYEAPVNGSPITVANETTTFNLPEDQDLYVYPVNNNVLGLSTSLIEDPDNLLMFASSGSNNLASGDIHSLKVIQDNTLNIKLIKNQVVVETETPHGLSLGDFVEVDCKSGITTSLVVKYNDANRRMVVGSATFAAVGINTALDTITIKNHGFRTGEKVIHESASPCQGLTNQKIYYVFVVNENTLKLNESRYEAQSNQPNFVNIGSQSFGTLSKVNPYIEITKYSTLKFNLSDSSLSFIKNSVAYPAFKLELFLDSDFKTEFLSSQTTSRFEVKENGVVGVSANASLEITFNENVPTTLYYKLTPIDLSNNTAVKLSVVVDVDQYESSKISLVDSRYSGRHKVVDTDPDPFTFKYTILDYPESPEYTGNTSIIEYTTDSKNVTGPIHSIKLLSGGKGYSNLPYVSGVASTTGKDCILEAESTSIGAFNSYEIQDIGFDYPADLTIRPKAKLPEIIKVEPLSIIDNIEVTFVGINYNESPDLVVLDGVTETIVNDVELEYDIRAQRVDVITNTAGINNVEPIIIPINNTNGYEIKSITFDALSKDVTLELAEEFSDPEDFPFTVGGKILIENVSVASTEKGYNSSVYDYKLFSITSLDANIGGIGATVSYSLKDELGTNESPGTYNKTNVTGIVVPESHFPRFKTTLTKKSFSNQETVVSNGVSGNVESWDANNEILKVTTNRDLVVGGTITGQTSGTKAIIKNLKSFDGFYDVGSSSIVKSGWKTQTGFLNNEFQRLHDSDYYQYFSYSIKSNVSFDVWKEPVETLNHTAGFKKFSDLIVESTPVSSGINTEQNEGVFSGTVDFYSVTNTNCVKDFDLVRENSLVLGNTLKSNEIYFNSRVLQDYIESFGNKVLMIDDISPEFNSNPRTTPFSVIDSFKLSDTRYRKYFIHCNDKRFSNKTENSILSLLQYNTNGYLNHYARVSSEEELGYFDFSILGSDGNLLFYPLKFEVDNYNLEMFAFNIDDAVGGGGEIILGDSAQVKECHASIAASQTTPETIVSIATSFRSLKALVQLSAIDRSYYEVNEISVIHNGTDAYVTEYGQLTTGTVSGIGTYGSYISDGNLIIDITPSVGYASTITVNSLVVALADENYSGVGTTAFNQSSLSSKSVSIASSTTPVQNLIDSYSNSYSTGYYIISVKDKTNNEYQLSEFLTLYNGTNDEVYYTEFGIVDSNGSLGEIQADVSGTTVEIYFTPNPGIECDVKVFELLIGKVDVIKSLPIGNTSLSISYGFYTGTANDVKKSFNLTHKQLPIFERAFNAEDSNVVNLETNRIRIPENFFVTGEEVSYVYGDEDSPVGINTTSIAGIGTTDKLPGSLYIIKLNDLDVQVAASASLALKTPPVPLELNQLGIGTDHRLVSKKQNTKCLISIDNIIQSPIAGSATTAGLAEDVTLFDGQIKLDTIDSFYGGDMIQVDNEIMRIVSVGIGSTNVLVVDRELMGTGLSTHVSGITVTKVNGNYNIVDNVIHFSEAPYGQVPILNQTNRFDEVDYENLEISSSFNGRVFIRSGFPNSNLESYSYNYIFDDISNNFTGYENDFTLQSNSQNVVGISTGNSVILVNSVFQTPERSDGPVVITGNYDLQESSGITTVSFVGNPVQNTYDVNSANLPRGGIIVSLGSTEGFGYQPLVSAGGTAIVSIGGTIESISIGNSGSGYRVGIQTIVNVGVQTASDGIPNIEYVGVASVLNGNVVSVAITNPGFGYTFTNPPVVVFDDPLSYANLPLIYSNQSSGIGTGAVVDVVVGQGSSVISFELRNNGFGYKRGDILTVGYGGTVGIPTNPSLSFNEFQIVVTETQNDSFSGWSFGDLQVLDPIDEFFDGERKSFPLRLNGLPKTIRSRVGSNIDVQATLLVFINDILQVPGESYTFNGGSIITFNEAPKGPFDGIEGTEDTSKILFYRGTAEIDTVTVDVLETVKPGDTLTINSSEVKYQQTERIVNEIKATDIVGTNLYSKLGISDNEALVRPVTWCRQTEDIFINGSPVAKNRIIYEPLIQPTTNIIRPIGSSDTEIFVDSVKTFFDNISENETNKDSVVVISQDTQVSAAATAVVSVAGTIASITLSSGGVGYSTNPKVSIAPPQSGIRALATASISVGVVTSTFISNAGTGYTFTNPPQVLIESPLPKYEVMDDVLYEGDFGIIVGINTTSVGVASTGLVLDLFVPVDSFLRDSSVNNVGLATTGVSGIQTGYYFTLQNTNIGSGVTSLDSNGNIVGSGSSYLDGIYQAVAVSVGTTIAPGIGTTTVTKVTVSLSSYNGLTGVGFSEFYGEYSWGRIYNISRSDSHAFDSYNNGLVGIQTSPVVQRISPLKYRDYLT